jgi:hypothetical protein
MSCSRQRGGKWHQIRLDYKEATPVACRELVTNFSSIAAGLPVEADVYTPMMVPGSRRWRLGALAAVSLVWVLGTGCSSNSTTSPTPATTGTETFNGYLSAGTQVSRAVTLTQSSTLSATLNSTSPSGVQVGLGLGLLDGSDCALTQAITAGAGASVSATTDAGTYCVDLYDIGQVGKAPLSFTVTIDYH